MVDKIIYGIFAMLLLTSCFSDKISADDPFENKRIVYAPYYVSQDSNQKYFTLWYDPENGDAIDRVFDIKRVGHINSMIIAETEDGFYFIDSQKESKNSDFSDIMVGPKNHNEFLKMLDSLKISDFHFDYFIGK